MKESINLIKNVNTKLTFCFPYPNLGFASACAHQEWQLCDDYSHVICNKIDNLISKMGTNNNVKVQIALMKEEVTDFLVSKKADTLLPIKARKRYANSGEGLNNLYSLLKIRLNSILKNGMSKENFSYYNWKISLAGDNNSIAGNVPPISILIADNNLAIIIYNDGLFSDNPISLRGNILRSEDEIAFFNNLIDSYLAQYAEKVPNI